MAWQGVPFKYFGNPFTDSGILSLGKIPTIVVDTGFGYDTFWASILGALVGAVIPSIIAWKTIKINKDALTQERKE